MNILLRKIAYRTKLWNEWAKEQSQIPPKKQEKFQFVLCPNNYHKTFKKPFYGTYTEVTLILNQTRVEFYNNLKFYFGYVLLPYSEEVKAKKWTCEKIWDENYVKNTKENS